MRRELRTGCTGGAEAGDPADPVPRPGEVLIKVAAAGINGPDLYQRRGLHPAPPGVTDIPGLEVSGTIVTLAHVRPVSRANRLDRTVHADLFARARDEASALFITARRVGSQGHPW